MKFLRLFEVVSAFYESELICIFFLMEMGFYQMRSDLVNIEFLWPGALPGCFP